MKKILQTLSRKWPEYLLEILVITIGIYGAFALDNWNENRKEIEKEKVVLTNVLADILKNKELIDSGINSQENNLQESLDMSNLLGKQPTAPNIALMDTLIATSAAYTTIDFVLTTISSASSGEQLARLQNENLRKMLVEFTTYVEQYKEREFIVRSLVIDNIRPSLKKHISMSKWLKIAEAEVEDRFVTDYSSLFKDKVLSNNYVDRYFIIKHCIERLKKLREANTELIQVVESELNSRFQ